MDPWRLNDELLLATLTSWDLKAEDGSPLPITMEAIRAQDPALVEALIEHTQRLNGVTREERKK